MRAGHQAPECECACGLYGYHQWPVGETNTWERNPLLGGLCGPARVGGLVAARSTVLVHEECWRASVVRIVGFVICGPSYWRALQDRIAQQFGLPLWTLEYASSVASEHGRFLSKVEARPISLAQGHPVPGPLQCQHVTIDPTPTGVRAHCNHGTELLWPVWYGHQGELVKLRAQLRRICDERRGIQRD